MSKHELRDRNDSCIGTIENKSNDMQEGRDPSGRRKGTYDASKNETRDGNGRIVGQGNLLSALVASPSSSPMPTKRPLQKKSTQMGVPNCSKQPVQNKPDAKTKTGRVGLFWWWDGQLLAESVPLEKGDACDGIVNGPWDHVDVWPKFEEQHPCLRGTDYIHFARGRVLYRCQENTFIVYLDRKISKPKIKAAVLAHFRLPKKSTRFEFDNHYTTDPQALDRLFGGD